MGVAFSAGMVGGPALASLLGTIDESTTLPVVAALVISLVTWVIIYVGLPHAQPCGGDLTELTPDESSAHAVSGIEHRDCHYAAGADEVDRSGSLSRPGIRYTLLLQFGILVGFNLFYATFPVHAATELEWSVQQVGLYFSVLAGLLVVVEGPILDRMSRVFASWQLTATGLVLLSAHFVVLVIAEGNVVYVAAVLFAFGNGLMWPSISAFLSGLATDEIQGTVQGIAGSVSSLASIIGLLVGGALFASLDVVVFLMAGAVMLLAAAGAGRLRGYSVAAA
jgi:hypothetical protein